MALRAGDRFKVWSLGDAGADPQLSPVLFGASLILLMMVAPGGILGLYRRGAAWLGRQWRRVGSTPTRGTPDAVASYP